jgi:hypothetical protein
MVKSFFYKKNRQKGAVAILLVFLILSVTLLISAGLSVIFVQQIKNSSLMSQSTVAFYAADAGSEYALYQIMKKNINNGNYNETFSVGSIFSVSWSSANIISRGEYGKTTRKVEVNF